MRRAAFAVFTVLVASSSFAFQNALWIPGWGSAQLNSIQTNAGALNESNPVWYGWNPDATLTKKSNAENPTWRAAMTGTLVIPTVQNTTSSGFDANAAATMLATAASRDAHATTLVDLAIAQAYDGIDVDYERVPTTSRANFSAFITTLAGKLHAVGKKLSVSVYPKTSDAANWDGPGAQDWVAIGAVADSIKIMAYDYHWSTSGPGPIAPLSWLDQVATYAESAMPAQKIMMGLPFYGYDWNGSTGVGITYATAIQTAQNNGVAVSYDANGEATYSYSTHTVFFQDASSYQRKVDLLKQNHASIGGFTAWAAGQEDPAVWNVIKGTTGGGTPAPAADFVPSGPSSVTVVRKSATSGTFSIAAVNGFTGTATVSAIAPAGFRGTVTPSSSTISVATTVTLKVSAGKASAGIYPVVVRFTSGALVHDLTINVVIQ